MPCRRATRALRSTRPDLFPQNQAERRTGTGAMAPRPVAREGGARRREPPRGALLALGRRWNASFHRLQLLRRRRPRSTTHGPEKIEKPLALNQHPRRCRECRTPTLRSRACNLGPTSAWPMYLLYHPDIGASRQRGCHPSRVDLMRNHQNRWCRPCGLTTGHPPRSLRDQEPQSVATARDRVNPEGSKPVAGG